MDYTFTGVTLGDGTTTYRGSNMCCDTKDVNRRIQVTFNDCTTSVEDATELNLAIGAGLRYKNYEILQKSVPESGLYRDEYTNAGSSLVFDIDVASDRLKDFVFGDGTEQTGRTEYSIF